MTAMAARLAATTLLTVAAMGAMGAMAGTASAQAPERWQQLGSQMAEPWPDLQRANGTYPNWLGSPSIYAEALLGFGILQRGVVEDDDRFIDSGLRAITYAVTRGQAFRSRESVFENFAVASAYNFARSRLGKDSRFKQVRGKWESFLRRVTPVSLFFRRPRARRYGNHYIVEALGMLELLRSGLSSSRSGAALGGKRGLARSGSLRLLLTTIPRLASKNRTRTAGTNALVFSDRPDNPLAYQGLSLALYARAIELLGSRAPKRARNVIQQAARATWFTTAPDGAGGYFGRSQEEAWSLAGATLGSEIAARAPGSSRTWDRRFRAVSERALTRLRDDYGVGPNGLYIVPALREGIEGRLGTDGAPAPEFSGLTLVLTDWALEQMDRANREIGALASDSTLRATLSKGESRFAVVRQGPTWMAVRQTKSADRGIDLRYDFGLIAFKTLSDGRWRDVLPLRPRRIGPIDSVGPTLLAGGTRGLPFGSRISTQRGGQVNVVGGFRTARGRVLRRGVRFTFRPLKDCVRMTVGTRRGDRIEQDFFLRRRSGPAKVSSRSLNDDDQRITTSARFDANVSGRYTSAIDANLQRARLRFASARNGRITVVLCPEGATPTAPAGP